MRDLIWRCRDGRLVTASEMTTPHILNCIRAIQRSVWAGHPWRIEYLDRFELELEIREMRNRGEI